MDKQESKLTSTASAFDNKCRRRRKGEAVEPHTASTRPLILPNSYVSDSNLTRNLSDGSVTPAGNGDNTRSHGYSSHRPVREATNRNRSIHTKTLKNHNDPQGRIIGKKSVDTQKKGFRDVRSAPNSARKAPPQTNFVPFEVKMADFPQLAGDSLTKGAHPVTQKESWGPGSQSTIPQSSWKWVETRGSTDPLQNPPDVKVSAPVSPAAQPLVTSWANIASQPPKKQPVFTDQTISSNAMQTKDAAQNEEGPPGKKKRKKKKKTKNSGEDAEAESQDQIFCQEPPKFEDDEEFPDLAVAVSGADKFITSSKKKLCNEENQREGEKHWPGDLNKEKLPAGKTQPTEAAKTGQKAEKISGKKSKVPVQLDIGNVLAALEKQQQSKKSKQDAKPVVLSVGGGLPVVQKQAPALKKPHWQQDKIAHNPLDSTSPLVKKGKQREVPKAKKPTPLKKIILKEREERKQRRLQEERGLLPEDESTITNDAAEEQDDENTDDVGCLSQEFDDLLTLNGTDLIIGDVDKETDKDETVQQEISSAELLLTNTPKIHSRRFRDYCSQMLNKDLDECVTSLLKELVRFQDRLYQKDPMKARMKRRIVMGLREVMKHLKLRKVKCVIISPNCERIQSKGGLDEALHTIINMCREQAVPFVFALSRKALGRCVNKAVPVSLVGIFNYDGAQEYYHRMIELSSEARRAYEEKLSSLELKDQEDSEQDANPEQEINSFTEEPEEPEYLKFWKKMLEKESSHAFLNFEEQLSSLRLDSDCTENTEEES